MTRLIRFVAAALVGLAALPAMAQNDIGNLSEAERSALRAEVRSYLLENPEVIFEAIQILEQRREQAAQTADKELVADNSDALFNDGYSYVGGNPDGDVTLVEFLDYRCGYCKRAHPEVQQVLEMDPNIRYVVKEFPILGPDSVTAARMAMAALEIDPAKYPELNDRLMTHEGALTEQAAYRIARDLGYDIAELKQAAKAQEITDKVQKNYALAAELGIQGTPSFVIGDQVIRGYVEADELLAAADRQREQASN